MKNYLFLFLLILISSGAMAQEEVSIEASAVPAKVMQKFKSMFPDKKDVSWSRVGTDYYAEFGEAGEGTSVLFDAAGNWQETEMEMNKKDLPAKIVERLNLKYPGLLLMGAKKTVSANEPTLYEVDFNYKGKQYYMMLDETGNVLTD